MNFFLEQGRCRVCGKIFCCYTHQRQHEQLEHEEYSYWLDILPVICRTCHRRISTINDLNAKCIRLSKHSFPEMTFSGTPRPCRKRRINENILLNAVSEIIPDCRKRLIPIRKQKNKQLTNFLKFFFVDVNEIKMNDAAINAIFSPQLNISSKILSSDAKSSTPLIEEKENIAIVSLSVEKDVRDTFYDTPENKSTGTSYILVSALKKNISPVDANKKTSDGRRVTFEAASPAFSELSIYSTPMITMSSLNKTDVIEYDTETDSRQLITIISPTVPTQNIESDFHHDASILNQSNEHKFTTMARNMRLTLNGIPRSLSNMWQWTQRKIGRKRERDECNSPMRKRREFGVPLKRRPISSYWVNKSLTSLKREPLPNYKEKYSSL